MKNEDQDCDQTEVATDFKSDHCQSLSERDAAIAVVRWENPTP